MSKNTIALILILVFVLSLLPYACSQPAPPTPTSPTPTPAPTPTPSTSTKILKFAYDMPKQATIVPGWEWFASELEKRTNGAVKIDFYPGQTLFKSDVGVESLASGVADIAQNALATNLRRFPVLNVFTLPSVHFPDTPEGHAVAYKALGELLKFPEINNELKQFKPLFFHVIPANLLMSKSKKIVVPNDLKGLKVASVGLDADLVKLAGGASVALPPPDVYMAIDKGVVDASMAGWFLIPIHHFEEVAKYYLDYGFGQNIQLVMMNIDTWNSLSPNVQNIMMELAPETQAKCGQPYFANIEKGKKAVKDKNGIITTPTAEQIKLWDDLVKPLDDVWLKSMKDSGISDAQDILNLLKQRSAEAWK